MAIFTGTTGIDTANASSATLTGFTGGSLAELQDVVGDIINGLGGADIISAGDGDDTINGGTGADVLSGAIGNDLFILLGGDFAAGEVIDGGTGTNDRLDLAGANGFRSGTVAGIERLIVRSGSSSIFTATQFAGITNLEAQFVIGSGLGTVEIHDVTSIDLTTLTTTNYSVNFYTVLYGTNGADTLQGYAAAPVEFYGGAGADTLVSNSDSSRFNYVTSTDIESGEVITGSGSANFIMLKGVAGTTYDFSGAIITNIRALDFAFGGGGTVTLAPSQVLAYNGGLAQIFGSTGVDRIVVNGSEANMSGIQFYLTGLGSWTEGIDEVIINGTSGDDELYGSGVGDKIFGFEGDDVLGANGGADYLDGGTGIDLVSYDYLGFSGLTVNLSLPAFNTGEAANDTFVSIEGVRGTPSGDMLIGTPFANILEGSDGIDQLFGLGGVDTLNGGYDDDTIEAGEGNDLILAIHELDGEDTIDGGIGVDTLDYSAIVSNNTINVTLNGATIVNVGIGGGNTDHISNIENIIGAPATDTLTGDANENLLDGRGGTDVLSGGSGNDTLIGGSALAGQQNTLDGGDDSDTASYSGAANTVYADLRFNVGHINGVLTDLYTSIENLTGGSFNDVLFGNTDNNVINGAGGIDTLVGGLGADTLIGGGGWDTASYSGATAGIVAGMSGWTNFGEAAGDTFSGVEGIFATNFNDSLGGDGLSNALYGNGGNDTLFGYGGADYLYGGNNNDTLNGGLAGDLLDGGNNTDTASYASAASGVTAGLSGWTNFGEAAGDSYVSIENLTGSGFADNLGGNASANQIEGGNGTDNIFGYDGNDILVGGDGGDTLNGGNNMDTASYAFAAASVTAGLSGWTNFGEAAGDTYVSIENLTGSGFADNLGGNASANAINGGNGNDTIYGYGGADTLTGGANNDTFVWSAGDGNDFITDFQGGAAVGDVIRLLGSGFTSFAQMMATPGAVVQTGAMTQSEIHIGASVIYVYGIPPGQFAADDFLFA